jgi:stage II sporulation protein P
MVFFGAGIYIIFYGGMKLKPELSAEWLKTGGETVRQAFVREAVRCLYPGFFQDEGESLGEESLSKWYIQRVLMMHPLSKLSYAARQTEGLESTVTYEMLVSGGVQDESEPNVETEEDRQIGADERLAEMEYEEAAESQEQEETEELLYSMEELSDYDFLLSKFYTVEENTEILPEELNAEELLAMDMSIDRTVDGPQILIYHTHSQEGFVDSVPGDNSTTIVGVGEYLTQLLREKGYEVLHVTSVYDLVDGKLDRNEAYSKAYEEISAILEENPSIQSVIDLHRDGVAEGTRLVTEIDGKTMARFMFFNGLSRTKKNGPIEYLYNPYIRENLALTLQLKLKCEQEYPGLARNIYLKSLRYNLHLSDKALLIEAGAQTNTLQEMLNTMEPLADVLDKVFGS